MTFISCPLLFVSWWVTAVVYITRENCHLPKEQISVFKMHLHTHIANNKECCMRHMNNGTLLNLCNWLTLEQMSRLQAALSGHIAVKVFGLGWVWIVGLSIKTKYQTNINVWFPSCFPLMAASHCVLFFCNALMAPSGQSAPPAVYFKLNIHIIIFTWTVAHIFFLTFSRNVVINCATFGWKLEYGDEREATSPLLCSSLATGHEHLDKITISLLSCRHLEKTNICDLIGGGLESPVTPMLTSANEATDHCAAGWQYSNPTSQLCWPEFRDAKS